MTARAADSGAAGADTAAARLLNFGCGATFHPAWINIDTVPASPEVMRHDLLRPFPFADGSFDAVYGSHVLEHFEPAAAQRLLGECHRILKPGGIIRLVVPDLETIARLYLEALAGARAGGRDAELRYDWLMLELYDQVVRQSSGGSMAKFLDGLRRAGRLDLIADRIDSGDGPVAAAGLAGPTGPTGRTGPTARTAPTRGARLRRKLRSAGDSLRRRAALAAARLFLGARGSKALREGLFRNGGEIHQWMYDRFSMTRALEQAGFESIAVARAGDSAIAGFAAFALEQRDGRERKPDSLYMEGRKGAATID